MPPRLTVHRRQQIALQERMVAEFTEIVYSELQWLMRAVRTRLKTLQVQKVSLSKADLVRLNMWDEFEKRLVKRDRKSTRLNSSHP
jgi:hypothetical protein